MGDEMPVVTPWKRISLGNPKKTVLAVDFDVTGRLEANFADLLQRIPAELEVWQTNPPPGSYRKPMSETEYLSWWSEPPGGDGAEVEVVMGYCVGSVFASAVVDEIERIRGIRPRLVIFDPEWPKVHSLYRDFEKAITMMSILTPGEQQQVEVSVRAIEQTHGEDFDAVSSALIGLYETTGKVAFDRLGLDEDVADELLGLFRAYVSYLAAARQLRPERAWASAPAITSMHSSRGAQHAASETRFPVGHEELLRSAEVAALAARLIDSEKA
jgi:hypothetical protein